MYFTVLYIEYSSEVSLFEARMSGSKHKSNGDVAGTTVFFKVLYVKIKNVFFMYFLIYHLCENYYKPSIVQ